MNENIPNLADHITSILKMYGFSAIISDQIVYIHEINTDEPWIRIILSVLPEHSSRVVIKLLHDAKDIDAAREKTEKQSEFSEIMRKNGILTPKRYKSNGRFCNSYVFNSLPCNVTVEDWCGEEVREITPGIAYKIGELMARMHLLSLEHDCRIGCGTLFSAAYWNDVDAYDDFCQICRDPHLDQSIASEIKRLRDQHLSALRSMWETLPRSAVQGDISINNLVYSNDTLTVFDYNNAGDEVLVSDLVMEGLLTAYEMELPDGASRAPLFPALLGGYLSLRPLSDAELAAARIIYALYNSLWFTRVTYNDDSLQKLVQRSDYISANALLSEMLKDIRDDNGVFPAPASPAQDCANF